MNTKRSIQMLSTGILAILVLSIGRPGNAETPIRQRAIDVFSLHDGTRLLGISMTSDRSETTRILLRGTWLQRQLPQLYQQLLRSRSAGKPQDDQTVVNHLTRYLETLRSEMPDDLERIGFLQERLTDLKSEHSDVAVFDVVLLELPSSSIRNQFLQKPTTRRIGGLAVLNNIEDAETLSVDEIGVALKQRAAATELLTDVPNPTSDADEAEFLRLLMATERVCAKTCRLIDHAGQYLSADAEAASLETLLPTMMQGQLQSQLQELLGEPVGAAGASTKSPMIGAMLAPKAAAIAAAEDCRLVEVSQLELDPARGSARVRIDLYFKAPDQAVWKKMQEFSAKASAEDVSPEQMQRIKDDTRVKQVTDLFGSLGAGANSLTKAIAVGAAVEVAQNRATANLSAYLSNSPPGNAAGLRILRATLTELPAAGAGE